MTVNDGRDDKATGTIAQGETAAIGRNESIAGKIGTANGPAGAAERSEASTADRAAEAPEPGITGASTSQRGESGGGGLDWLEVSCYGSWELGKFHELNPRLSLAKQAAQNEEPGAWIEHPDGGQIKVGA